MSDTSVEEETDPRLNTFLQTLTNQQVEFLHSYLHAGDYGPNYGSVKFEDKVSQIGTALEIIEKD